MVRFALDSNTVSYALRDEGAVASRLRAIGPRQIVLPSLVVFEVKLGLIRVGRHRLIDAFERMVQTLPVIDFDLEAAEHAATIRAHLDPRATPIGLADLLIAATARRHGCTLVTHNTREFARVPDLRIEDWY